MMNGDGRKYILHATLLKLYKIEQIELPFEAKSFHFLHKAVNQLWETFVRSLNLYKIATTVYYVHLKLIYLIHVSLQRVDKNFR